MDLRGSKHGVRLALDLPPMQPNLARLPMKTKTPDRELQCNTCHGAHRYNTRKAAVESCLGITSTARLPVMSPVWTWRKGASNPSKKGDET